MLLYSYKGFHSSSLESLFEGKELTQKTVCFHVPLISNCTTESFRVSLELYLAAWYTDTGQSTTVSGPLEFVRQFTLSH
jgi:hypothetical protein